MAASFDGGRRRPGAAGGRRRPMSDINVTPLVDVMLVLLVIFMITAPLLTTGVQVDLPSTQAAAMPNDDAPIAVSITRDGRVFLGDDAVTLDQLAQRLQAIAASKADARVFIRGDQTIAYGKIMAVVGTIHDVGLRKVALLTQPADAQAASVRSPSTKR